MSLYERSADIPLVSCTICSGKHRPEAVEIDTNEGFPRYIAGTVTCPVGRSADEWYAAGDQPRLTRMDERAARTANWFSVPVLPIPRAWPGDRPDERPASTAEPLVLREQSRVRNWPFGKRR